MPHAQSGYLKESEYYSYIDSKCCNDRPLLRNF